MPSQDDVARAAGEPGGAVLAKGLSIRDPTLPERTVVLRPSMIKTPAGVEAGRILGHSCAPLIRLALGDVGPVRMGKAEMLLREACGVPAETIVAAAMTPRHDHDQELLRLAGHGEDVVRPFLHKASPYPIPKSIKYDQI